MTKPNLFIVGAPKCGTTSLCFYLGQHPDIFVCDPKEPFYFGSDFTRPGRDLNTYLKLFEAGRNQRYRCDGSTWYLFSKTAAQEIFEFNPDARIIIMVRNPVEVLQSLVEQRMYDRTDTVNSLEEALALEGQRRMGKSLPQTRWKLPPEKYFYSEVPRFAEQIERYLRVFGRSRVMVIPFEKFQHRLSEVMEELEAWLELKAYGRYDLSVQNKRKVLSSPRLKDRLLNLPGGLRKVWHWVTTERFRKKLFAKFDRINRKPAAARQLSVELRSKLISQYKEEEKRLTALLGSDFHGLVQ